MKVAVIGSGVMGAGIAAIVANSETQVYLFDIKSKEEANSIVKEGFNRIRASKPEAFTHPDMEKYVTLCNLEDDFHFLKEVDWIVEAIIEDINIKQSLYARIETVMSAKTVISSNTSTIPLVKLVENRGNNFQQSFFISHFFNPPRYMKLLEFITHDQLDLNKIEPIKEFIFKKLGKTIINCHDTPGFIANRLGCYLLFLALDEATSSNTISQIKSDESFKSEDERVYRVVRDPRPDLRKDEVSFKNGNWYNTSFAEIDLLMSKPFGFPKTAIFGLIDLIGVDVMMLIAESLIKNLAKTDDIQRVYANCRPVLEQMRAKNLLGRKSGSGFFKFDKTAKPPATTMLNLRDFSYENFTISKESQDLAKGSYQNIIENHQIISNIYNKFKDYCLSCASEIADDVNSIDDAMKLGYNWRFGPFELFDRDKYYQESKKYSFKLGAFINNDKKKYGLQGIIDKQIINSSGSCNLWRANNIGIVELTSKMNTLDNEVFSVISDAIANAESYGIKALVIGANEKIFSVGANINLFHDLVRSKDLDLLKKFIMQGQKTMMDIKYSKIPVVPCVSGYALGGACEIILHSHHLVACIESNIGLVETKIGVIPGWGGTKEVLLRCKDANQAFQVISKAEFSKSLDYAIKEYKIASYTRVANEQLLIDAAISKAVELSKNFIACKKLGNIDIQESNIVVDQEKLMPHQYKTLKMLEKIVTVAGKYSATEEELLDLELESFMELVITDEACIRIEKLLQNGEYINN